MALSGGKDSAALAVYMGRQTELNMEYVFADTGRELPDTYRFIKDLSAFLNVSIHTVTDYGRNFDYYLDRWNYFLPGNASRWCTKHLKLRPFERYCGARVGRRFHRDAVIYIAIRADEPSDRGNYGIEGVTYRYPFREDGIDLEGVRRILDLTGLRLPDYYEWRSTGGCYMCPWQRDSDWRALAQRYPDLAEKAMKEEEKAAMSSANPANSQAATWSVSRRSIKEILSQGEMFPIERHADTAPCLICAK